MKNYNIVDDLNFISDSCLPELKIIANKSILITGGTGFFWKMVYRIDCFSKY